MATKQKTTYLLDVDYGRSVEDGVKAGRYSWSDFRISSFNFPTTQRGRVQVEVELVHFDVYISKSVALRSLDERGFRPADIHELLALGEQYPQVQCEFSVVALGSVWRDERRGASFVPSLIRYGGKRWVLLHRVEYGWDDKHRFAAVLKPT